MNELLILGLNRRLSVTMPPAQTDVLAIAATELTAHANRLPARCDTE
jgi:hypothetical protein